MESPANQVRKHAFLQPHPCGDGQVRGLRDFLLAEQIGAEVLRLFGMEAHSTRVRKTASIGKKTFSLK